MLQFRSKETLDHGDRGWLKARHHFIVSANGNPANGALGALVVWNDDEIAPGTGFGRHTHSDMEIVTYVREGAVTHETAASADDCRRRQVMAPEPAHRAFERNRATNPQTLPDLAFPRRWETRWDAANSQGSRRRLIELAVKSKIPVSLIRRRARPGATLLPEPLLPTCRRVPARYLAPARGVIIVNGQRVAVGDGIAAIDEPELTIAAEEDAEFILVDAA